MGINKSGMGTEELEIAAGKLLLPKVREFFEQGVFPPHDLAKLETHIRRVNTPGSGMGGQVKDFGSVKQRLRWHAAPQDTKAADLHAAFDNDGLEAFGGGGSSGRVAGAAAADDCEVEVEPFLRFSHEFMMG